MSLTRPTYTSPEDEDFTLRVVAATSDVDMDGPQLSLNIPGWMVDTMTDQDVDDIAEIISNRLCAAYPDYYVAVQKSWSNKRNATSAVFTQTP